MDYCIALLGIIFSLSLLAISGIVLLLLLRWVFRCITRNPTREKLEEEWLAKLRAEKKLKDDDA